uniref:Reverse transcriptase domain-containing protein n=1 Tax=Oryzias latipes TaxID=8090 RepID=A0A3B3IL18_ORYLA
RQQLLFPTLDKPLSSAFFLGLEKKKQGRSIITALYDAGGNVCTETDEILTVVENFYKGLFNGGGCDEHAVEACVGVLTARVGDEDKTACDADITVEEIRRAIDRQNRNKSPGADGLTAEFYQCFRDDLVPLLSRMFGSFCLGRLPTFCLGTVKLLFKNKRDRADLDNYRPITLLNTDYKILTSVLAERLREVLPSILGSSQAYGVQGRQITDTVLSLLCTVEHMERSGFFFLNVDFSKAFDRVEHGFLWRVLDLFGFGELFISRIRALYTTASSRVLCNGHSTGVFSITRSIRQGCPLSAMLFSIAVEPLAGVITADDSIRGVVTPAGREIKMLAYADDTSLVLNNEASVDGALRQLQAYCRASGAKVNVHKSEIFFLGCRVISKFKYLGLECLDST